MICTYWFKQLKKYPGGAQENILVTFAPINTNKPSTVRFFLWPWSQAAWQRSDLYGYTLFTPPDRSAVFKQLSANSSWPILSNHGPALSKEELFLLNHNHANTSTAWDCSSQGLHSVPACPHLGFLCRCSLWEECFLCLELHRARRWVPKTDHIWWKEELYTSDKRWEEGRCRGNNGQKVEIVNLACNSIGKFLFFFLFG